MRLRTFIFLLFCVLIFLNSTIAFSSPLPLPSEQAFRFSMSNDDERTIHLQWAIAPGYYLYRDRMQVSSSNHLIADVQYPQGELKYSSDNKRYEVYSGTLNVPITLKEETTELSLDVDYQGCSQDGFCYPPMHKNMIFNLLTHKMKADGLAKENATFSSLLTNQQEVQQLLLKNYFSHTLLIFFGLGLLLSLTPCVLPMVPILSSIIAGHGESNTKKSFFLSLYYVLGSAMTYAIAGLFAAWLGSTLQVWLQQPFMIAFVIVLFILLACSLFGWYELRLPQSLQNKLNIFSHRNPSGTYASVFIMGAVSTLIVSPCVTAPLVGVLMYIGQKGNLLYGASALFVLGLGMGVPLLIAGTSLGQCLPRSGPWMNTIKNLFGVMMLGMAAWLSLRLPLPFLHNEPNLNSSFSIVHNMEELKSQIALAKTIKKPVALDFYADWCESCVTMDKNVFALTDVKKAMSEYVLLRADLSANKTEDEEMLHYFNVIAPPTMLFFNMQGKELNSYRIVGELSAKEFLNKFDLVRQCNEKMIC